MRSLLGFATTNNSDDKTISKYIDNLKEDIIIQTKTLFKENPNGYKLILLQDNLNGKYFEYENSLKANKTKMNLINKFKSDCFSLKNIMEENYIKNRDEICADVLYNICTDHSNIVDEIDIDSLDNDEITRRYDININVMSATCYNSISGWTFNSENQMHDMVKETLDIVREYQVKRLNDYKQLKLDSELNKIENQRKRQKQGQGQGYHQNKNEIKDSSKKESLAEQQRKARQFMSVKQKNKSKALDDIDDDSPRPSSTSSSRKRKSLDDIEVEEEEFSKEDQRKKSEKEIEIPASTKSKKDVLAEARKLAAMEMEERIKAATANISSNKKTSNISSKKKR